MIPFEPTREAALARLAAVEPDAYARTRNAIDGAVTRLSPYLTHGLLSLREVYTTVHARHPLDPQHKLVFELGWRAYYRHVWAHRGDGIQSSLHAGLLPEDAYLSDMPADVLEARTGVPAIDLAVRTLYAGGYIHNHARMWLASYLVHMRKVHWHTGAQWMLAHLLDGDVASNHLSWQWVAGTGSVKPYLFNADNVAKYAPQAWHSFGTVIDASYETLDAIARNPGAAESDTAVRLEPGVAPPACTTTPTDARWTKPDRSVVDGRDVLLLHPWSLVALSSDPNEHLLTVAIGLSECHSGMPWTNLRWGFVTDVFAALTPHMWWGNTHQLADALSTARSVRWRSDPHIDPTLQRVQALLNGAAVPPTTKAVNGAELFEPVSPLCNSFAQWWRKTRLAP